MGHDRGNMRLRFDPSTDRSRRDWLGHPMSRLAVLGLPALSMIAALLLVCSTASASITFGAKQVVERYRRAVGDSAEWSGLHSRGRVQSAGFKGTFESWWASPSRIVTYVGLGPLRVQEGFDGLQGWRVDRESGQLTPFSGEELETVQADAYFEGEMWTRHDQGGGKVTYVGTSLRGNLHYRVIQVTPPVGGSRRLWFNEKTGLLDRAVYEKDHHTVEITFSDYRRLGRRSWAMRAESWMTDVGAHVQTMELDSLWMDPPLDVTRFQPPTVAPLAVKWLKTKGRAAFPFRYGRKHVWLRASINGSPAADFLLDTGASTTVLDSTFAARAGLTSEGSFLGEGMAATGQVSLAKIRTLKVAGLNGDGVQLANLRVGVINISPTFEPSLWRPLAGLLGYDFLSRFVTEVDFDQQLLTLYEPDEFRYRGSGAPIPMSLTGNIPTIRMTVDGQCEGDFRVDVGSSATVDIHGSMVRRCGLMSRARSKREMVGVGFGGAFQSTLGRLDKIEVGPFSWTGPLVGLSLKSSGMLASHNLAGNIGNGILERFKCTFDYQRGELFLEPGTRYARRDRLTMFGTHFLKRGARIEVGGVLPDSPAHRAGLQPGDEVVSVDGRSIGKYDPEDLDRTFEEGKPGDVHEVVVKRDAKRIELKVTLAEVM